MTNTETPRDVVALDIKRGAPTPEELAAVVAVVSDAYAREIAEALAEDEAPSSAWARTQRSMRKPLRRDIPWGPFAGSR